MSDVVVSFKSWPENWRKELDGRKCNTVRKKDLDDARHIALGSMLVTQDYGIIEIVNTQTNEVFFRRITDVTDFEGMLIISWRHL